MTDDAVPFDDLPELVRDAIDTELEPWLSSKAPEIAAAWRYKLTRPGFTRVVAEGHTRRSGRPDTRTLDARVECLHSSGAWLPAFTVRLRGHQVRELIRALAVVPDDASAITDHGDEATP